MEERRVGLILPVLLILAAAMFAGSIGGDSVTGHSTSKYVGPGQACVSCKNTCVVYYNACMRSGNDDGLSTCVSNLGKTCEDSWRCANGVSNPLDMNDCRAFARECSSRVQECTNIVDTMAACEAQLDDCNTNCEVKAACAGR